MPMKIATWNLQRANTRRRRADAQQLMREIDADVWVLTESRRDLSPGPAYALVAESAPREEADADERWVTIWTRLEGGVPHVTRDDQFTACAKIAGRRDGALYVYGTVLPWRGSSWRGHASPDAQAYGEALSVQTDDWCELRCKGDLCVAGDFNQDLSDPPFYWSLRARALLERALRYCALTATTAAPNDPVRKLTDHAQACIDHVCLSPGLASRVSGAAAAWRPEIDARKISDHPGIVVMLSDS